MNKMIVIVISILVGMYSKHDYIQDRNIDCNNFHEKNVFDISIRLPLKRKTQTTDKYILEVKSESGVQKVVLLRNNVNKELFDYVIENDVLSKKAGEKEIRVARFDSQGNIFVRPFSKFCP